MIHLFSFIMSRVDLGSMLRSLYFIIFSDFFFITFYDVSTGMVILLFAMAYMY